MAASAVEVGVRRGLWCRGWETLERGRDAGSGACKKGL